MSHASTSRRAHRYGTHPQELRAASTREDMPRTPARLPRDYCKRLKGAHAYELDNVRSSRYVYIHKDWTRTEVIWVLREFRCTGCNKKRLERYEQEVEQSA